MLIYLDLFCTPHHVWWGAEVYKLKNKLMSTTEDRKESTVYEVGYLILPSVPAEALSEAVSKINKSIESAGGTRLDGEDPFLHPLAYQMRKVVGARKYVVDEAYLGWVKFEAEPTAAASVKADLEKMEEVLRFLLVKAPRESEFTFAKALKEKEDKIREQEERDALPEEASEVATEPVVE